jgi:hypothetical protein
MLLTCAGLAQDGAGTVEDAERRRVGQRRSPMTEEQAPLHPCAGVVLSGEDNAGDRRGGEELGRSGPVVFEEPLEPAFLRNILTRN